MDRIAYIKNIANNILLEMAYLLQLGYKRTKFKYESFYSEVINDLNNNLFELVPVYTC